MLKNWVNFKEELVFDVSFLRIYKRKYQLPDGQRKDFYIKQEGPSVCILGLTSQNRVVLAKQFRPGPEKIVLELPGGIINDEESPENAAHREFLEETGYIGNFQFIGISLDCAYSTMVRHNFVATQCHKVQNQKLDSTEFIEIVEQPLEEFRNHLRSGQLTDIETAYLGLDFLDLL
ncbi:MAG: NUDIX hydrolase [Candidatus Hodarchaeales archaeon]|jgi:ADP-ribose pyrophosphatase